MEQIEITNPETGKTFTASAKAYEAIYQHQGFVAAEGAPLPVREPVSFPPIEPNPNQERNAESDGALGSEVEGADAPKAARKRRSTGHPADPIQE